MLGKIKGFDRTKFRRRISDLRKERGLTQHELGKIIGIDDSTIANYELGARMPRIEFLIKVADFFGVSIDWLLGRTNTPQLSKFETAIKGLDPRVQQVLLDQENAVPYLEVVADCMEEGVPAGEIREFFNSVFNIKRRLEDVRRDQK